MIWSKIPPQTKPHTHCTRLSKPSRRPEGLNERRGGVVEGRGRMQSKKCPPLVLEYRTNPRIFVVRNETSSSLTTNELHRLTPFSWHPTDPLQGPRPVTAHRNSYCSRPPHPSLIILCQLGRSRTGSSSVGSLEPTSEVGRSDSYRLWTS